MTTGNGNQQPQKRERLLRLKEVQERVGTGGYNNENPLTRWRWNMSFEEFKPAYRCDDSLTLNNNRGMTISLFRHLPYLQRGNRENGGNNRNNRG